MRDVNAGGRARFARNYRKRSENAASTPRGLLTRETRAFSIYADYAPFFHLRCFRVTQRARKKYPSFRRIRACLGAVHPGVGHYALARRIAMRKRGRCGENRDTSKRDGRSRQSKRRDATRNKPFSSSSGKSVSRRYAAFVETIVLVYNVVIRSIFRIAVRQENLDGEREKDPRDGKFPLDYVR